MPFTLSRLKRVGPTKSEIGLPNPTLPRGSHSRVDANEVVLRSHIHVLGYLRKGTKMLLVQSTTIAVIYDILHEGQKQRLRPHHLFSTTTPEKRAIAGVFGMLGLDQWSQA